MNLLSVNSLDKITATAPQVVRQRAIKNRVDKKFNYRYRIFLNVHSIIVIFRRVKTVVEGLDVQVKSIIHYIPRNRRFHPGIVHLLQSFQFEWDLRRSS